MPSVVTFGLAGAAGLLVALDWIASPHTHRVTEKVLGWVLVSSSASLILLAAEPPTSEAPPLCLQSHGCVLHPRLLTDPRLN